MDRRLVVVGIISVLLMGCGKSYWATLSPPSPVVAVASTQQADVTFLYDAEAATQTGTFFYPYVVQQGKASWLRLRIQRSGSVGFAVNRVTVYVDGKIYPLLIAGHVEIERSIGSEREVVDIYATADDIAMLKDMAFGECMVEFTGYGGKENFPFAANHQEMTIRTLALYERLGNDLGR